VAAAEAFQEEVRVGAGKNLTKIEIESIQQTISKAEKKTSGEIVVAIMKSSHDYFHAQLIGATIISFGGNLISPFIMVPYSYILCPIIAWIMGYLLFGLNLVKQLLISKENITTEVKQRAFQLFFENGINLTKDQTGILIYVSLFERKIEVIADAGINQKVPQSFWDDGVNLIKSGIQNNDLINGINQAIDHFSIKLEEEFPIRPDDTNEISNLVITDMIN